MICAYTVKTNQSQTPNSSYNHKKSYMKPTIKSYPHIILQQHYKLNISNEWQTPTILTHIATSTIYKSVPPPPPTTTRILHHICPNTTLSKAYAHIYMAPRGEIAKLSKHPRSQTICHMAHSGQQSRYFT